jgi:hypothetical protein
MTQGPGSRSEGVALAWQTLRDYEEPDRYTHVAGPEHADVLATTPAALASTAADSGSGHARAYLSSSCDLTLSGGLSTAIAAPLAACALAERYILRRVGGAGVAALAAAAVAAAEYARVTGVTASGREDDPVLAPGYPRLARVTAWLAGDQDEDDAGRIEKGRDRAPADHWRIARMLQPSPGLRGVHRLLVAATRPRLGAGRRASAVTVAAASVPHGAAALVAGLVWAGLAFVWIGVTIALLRSPTVAGWVVALLTPGLLVTVVLAGLAANAVAALVTLRRLIGPDADDAFFGVVPGVSLDTDRGGPVTPSLADRLAGVPDPAGLAPLTTWFTGLVDDLAGVPVGGDDRHALTFGDLWLARPASDADIDRLRRAAADPEHRVLDLRLVATDITRGRSVGLPVACGSPIPWLLCPDCWHGVLPARVVDQVLAASPEPAAQVCPRHGTHLRPLPPPWQLPVVVAARLAAGVPGLLRSVPLYRAAVPPAAGVRDPFGARSAAVPDEGTPAPTVTTHWFTGSPPADAPVSLFDTAVPRWPTVALSVVQGGADDEDDGPWVEVPDADTAPPPAVPPAPVSGVAFARAVLAAPWGWRDRADAESPSTRNRIGIVRRGQGTGTAGFVRDAEVLRLALRGLAAGRDLRDRFTGPDGEIGAQTGTDRYRWIRIRSELRERRRESLAVAARLPLLTDLTAPYRVPTAVTHWFTPPIKPGRVDPAWADAAAALTHLRALTAEGVLDWDTDYGAPPPDPDAPG